MSLRTEWDWSHREEGSDLLGVELGRSFGWVLATTMMMREGLSKTLLLQIRESPLIAEEEYESFRRFGGLAREQMDRLDLFSNPHLHGVDPTAYDAIFVGGASDASVLEPEVFPFLEPARAFLTSCLDGDVPVFASCFGFQLAVQALGGEIVHQARDFEMGTIPIALTPEASEDPLFTEMPDEFYAVAVHREKAEALPLGCILLARTTSCCHAFRVEGKPFWAFQFHPEIGRATLISRLIHYRERYTEDDVQLRGVLESAVETPESNALVGRFLDWLEDDIRAEREGAPRDGIPRERPV